MDRTDAVLFLSTLARPAGLCGRPAISTETGTTTLADFALLQSHLGQSVPSPVRYWPRFLNRRPAFGVSVWALVVCVRHDSLFGRVEVADELLFPATLRVRCVADWLLPVVTAPLVPTAGFSNTWDNSSGNGLWLTASNWSDGSTPTVGDSVIFPLGFPNGDHIINLAGQGLGLQLSFSDSYTLSGSSLNIFSGDVTVNSGKSVAISSTLNGVPG